MCARYLNVRIEDDTLWEKAIRTIRENDEDVLSISSIITPRIIEALELAKVDPLLRHFGTPREDLAGRVIEYLGATVEDDDSTELGYGPEVRTTIAVINQKIAHLGLVAEAVQRRY